jgi:hypothetical protein
MRRRNVAPYGSESIGGRAASPIWDTFDGSHRLWPQTPPERHLDLFLDAHLQVASAEAFPSISWIGQEITEMRITHRPRQIAPPRKQVPSA